MKVASFEHNTHLARPIYERLFRLTSGRVNWLIADCETTADEVRERLYRKRPERQIVLPLVSFPPPAENARPAGNDGLFTVISAARFTDVKNQQALISAARQLKDRGDPVRFILYGEGPNFDRYQALARALDVTDMVSFPGFDPHWVDHRADLFTIVSKHEGLCIVALEAMSRGVPVLATRVGGLKDYGEPAKVCFLEEGTPPAIADAISDLVKNPALLAEMKAAGVEAVQSRFSDATIEARCAAFASDIHALIERPQPA
jgi:glycosyltransferase involved in cell wall biosynthesis